MSETSNISDNKRFTKAQQENNESIITFIWFLIQVIIAPIIYKNNTAINEINQIDAISLVFSIGLSYYIVKQIFFIDTDGWFPIIETVLLSIGWLLCLAIVGEVIVMSTNILSYDKLIKTIDEELIIIGTHIVLLVLIVIVTSIQQYIQEKSKTLKSSQTHQKLYQFGESTKYFIIATMILIVINIAVTLLTTQSMNGINWEKFITNVGIVYLTIMIGTMLRR